MVVLIYFSLEGGDEIGGDFDIVWSTSDLSTCSGSSLEDCRSKVKVVWCEASCSVVYSLMPAY